MGFRYAGGLSLREKCPLSGIILIRIFPHLDFPTPYSVRMRENENRTNSEYGQFLRSVFHTGRCEDCCNLKYYYIYVKLKCLSPSSLFMKVSATR